MAQDAPLNDRQKSFVDRTRKNREEKAIEMTNELLAVFINKRLPFGDVHYIIGRVKGILEDKIKNISFRNEMIDRYRREFFRSRLEEARKQNIKLKGKRDEREKRCEDVCQGIVDKVLDEKIAMSDDAYFEDAIENDDEFLMMASVHGYVDAIYDKLCLIAGENKRRADEKLWRKPSEEITWSDLNDVLS